MWSHRLWSKRHATNMAMSLVPIWVSSLFPEHHIYWMRRMIIKSDWRLCTVLWQARKTSARRSSEDYMTNYHINRDSFTPNAGRNVEAMS